MIYQVINLWYFEKVIRIFIVFHKIWKTYLEWFTSALGMEYRKKTFYNVMAFVENEAAG